MLKTMHKDPQPPETNINGYHGVYFGRPRVLLWSLNQSKWIFFYLILAISDHSETWLDPWPAKLDPLGSINIGFRGLEVFRYGFRHLELKKKKKFREILPFGLNWRLDKTSLAQKCAKCAKLPPLETLGPLIYIFLGWDWSGMVLDILNLKNKEKNILT